MATLSSILIPDYDGCLAIAGGAGVGTIATTASTGAIVLGTHRLFRIFCNDQTTATNTVIQFYLRFTMGNSKTGHAAITPTSTSPFFSSLQDIIFDTGDAYDSINLANLAADNTAVTIGYTILPLSKY